MTDASVAELLGLKFGVAIRWHERLLAGLPVSALVAFERKSGLDRQAVRQVVGIPERTLARLRSTAETRRTLPTAGSERLYSLAKLTALATELFEGDRAAAVEWLTSPAVAFSGETPLARSRTSVGTQEVEDLIGRLEHGVFS
jgi:putative toxin-antitoxin system antitoxin component (TIGR02293 family)